MRGPESSLRRTASGGGKLRRHEAGGSPGVSRLVQLRERSTMTTFLHVALANLAVASILAVLAIVVGRFCRRPALVHSLWLLVLLKLVTPPLVQLPVPWLPAEEPPAVTARPPAALTLPPDTLVAVAEPGEPPQSQGHILGAEEL